MKNAYEIRGDITAIFINSKKHGRQETLISTKQLDRAKEFTNSWRVVWFNTAQSFYVVGEVTEVKGKRKTILLHRWITNAPKGMLIDHINHDTLDNTDPNLRIVTNAENQQNRRGPASSSKSGVRGVSWNKNSKKWRAGIHINGVGKHIGLFSDIKEAEHAVIEERKKYMPFSKEAMRV